MQMTHKWSSICTLIINSDKYVLPNNKDISYANVITSC